MNNKQNRVFKENPELLADYQKAEAIFDLKILIEEKLGDISRPELKKIIQDIIKDM